MGTRLAQSPRRFIPALVAALAAGCIGSGTHSPPEKSRAWAAVAGSHARWIVHRDRRDALSIATPPGWAFTLRPVPRLLDPIVPFAVGSGAVPRGGGCAPTRAIGAVSRAGVLIWVYEYRRGVRARDFPVRPRHLRLGELGGPYECLGVRAYTIPFRIGQRYFQAHVVAHRASPRVRSQAERALASLAVLPA